MNNIEGELYANKVINQIEEIEQRLSLLKSQARVYKDKKQLLQFQYDAMIDIDAIFSKWSSDYVRLRTEDNN